MADVQPPSQRQQGAHHRTASVLVVALTMYLTALSLLATAIGLLATQADIKDAIETELLRDASFADAYWAADEIASIVTFSLRVTAVTYLFVAVFYLVLSPGPQDLQGKRSVRILSWILTGTSLACCGIGGIVMRFLVTSMSYLGESYSDQISNALLDATPTWLTTLQVISWTLLIAGSMLVIILLAVQDAKRGPIAPSGPGR
jgi:hypothetical protein